MPFHSPAVTGSSLTLFFFCMFEHVFVACPLPAAAGLVPCHTCPLLAPRGDLLLLLFVIMGLLLEIIDRDDDILLLLACFLPFLACLHIVLAVHIVVAFLLPLLLRLVVLLWAVVSHEILKHSFLLLRKLLRLLSSPHNRRLK